MRGDVTTLVITMQRNVQTKVLSHTLIVTIPKHVDVVAYIQVNYVHLVDERAIVHTDKVKAFVDWSKLGIWVVYVTVDSSSECWEFCNKI